MRATLRQVRCFLEDVEPGDVVRAGKRYYKISNVKEEAGIVTLFSDHLRAGGSPVMEDKGFIPITVYVRK